jgi:hypothetical protein
MLKSLNAANIQKLICKVFGTDWYNTMISNVHNLVTKIYGVTSETLYFIKAAVNNRITPLTRILRDKRP